MTSRALCVVTAVVVLQSAATIDRTIRQRHVEPAATATAAVSADGRTVVFESLAQLDPGDTNAHSDVYALDVPSGRIDLVSVGPDGDRMAGSAMAPRVSGDGRYVVFESVIPASQQACMTLFLRDRRAGATRALATSWRNRSQPVCAKRASISRNGEWVAFDSTADDLIEGVDRNGEQADVYIMNILTGRVARASLRADGAQSPDGSSFAPSLSTTGQFVAFTSTACLDGAPVRTCPARVYVRDLAAARTRGVLAKGGGLPDGASHSPAISGSGRFVAFVSTASNFVAVDTGDRAHVYVYDLEASACELVSRTRRGRAGDGPSGRPSISESGRFVAFDSTASDLLCARSCAARERDHNLVADVFVFDREREVLRRASEDPTGQHWWAPSMAPAFDAVPGVLVFSSRQPTTSDDTDADFDLFIVQLSVQ